MYNSISFSDRTVGFVLSGDLDSDAINNLHSEILGKMKHFRSIALYLEDDNIEKFSLPAILEQIRFKTVHAGSISKVALVTDKKWIQLCGSIENAFLPTTIRSFNSENREEAMEWIKIDEI